MPVISSLSPWSVLAATALGACGGSPEDMPPNDVVPSPAQVEYQEMEFVGFVHFTVNTFTDKEWGFGDESPEVFHPTQYDAKQWASVAAEVGMKELILSLQDTKDEGLPSGPVAVARHGLGVEVAAVVPEEVLADEPAIS